MSLFCIDLVTSKVTRIVEPNRTSAAGALTLATRWSPDSQVGRLHDRQHGRISHASTSTPRTEQIVPGDRRPDRGVDPVFDASGKYLYFLGSTDTGMSKHGFSAVDRRQPATALVAATSSVLKKDLPSPFLAKESDEEKGETPKRRPTRTPKTDPKAKKDEAKKEVDRSCIDFDGLDQRILSFPIAGRPNSANLQAGAAGQIFYLRAAEPAVRGDRLRRRARSTATTSTEAQDRHRAGRRRRTS